MYSCPSACKAVRNFDTKETLTVSLKDGTQIEVTIRDAEAMTTVTAAGDTYEVTLKYGFDSGLPEEGVSLEVSEIAPEDQAYEEYKAQAEKALGEDRADRSRERVHQYEGCADRGEGRCAGSALPGGR